MASGPPAVNATVTRSPPTAGARRDSVRTASSPSRAETVAEANRTAVKDGATVRTVSSGARIVKPCGSVSVNVNVSAPSATPSAVTGTASVAWVAPWAKTSVRVVYPSRSAAVPVSSTSTCSPPTAGAARVTTRFVVWPSVPA